MDVNSITIGTSIKVTTDALFSRRQSNVRVMTVSRVYPQGGITTPAGPTFLVTDTDGMVHSIDTNTQHPGARHAHRLNTGATPQGCSIQAA